MLTKNTFGMLLQWLHFLTKNQILKVFVDLY